MMATNSLKASGRSLTFDLFHTISPLQSPSLSAFSALFTTVGSANLSSPVSAITCAVEARAPPKPAPGVDRRQWRAPWRRPGPLMTGAPPVECILHRAFCARPSRKQQRCPRRSNVSTQCRCQHGQKVQEPPAFCAAGDDGKEAIALARLGLGSAGDRG